MKSRLEEIEENILAPRPTTEYEDDVTQYYGLAVFATQLKVIYLGWQTDYDDAVTLADRLEECSDMRVLWVISAARLAALHQMAGDALRVAAGFSPLKWLQPK